jgi:hypothetical protein
MATQEMPQSRFKLREPKAISGRLESSGHDARAAKEQCVGHLAKQQPRRERRQRDQGGPTQNPG